MLVEVVSGKAGHVVYETRGNVTSVVHSGVSPQSRVFAQNVLKYVQEHGKEVQEGVFEL